ncbi:PEP-CTERM system TPR-repeat lipoprotein [Methylomonas albis]|nr:PEP-CTERM system TPR-repeat lipoprotein [Methylomonas albis]
MRKNPMKSYFPLNKLLLILALNPIQISFADDIQAGKFYEEALQSYRSQNNAEAIIQLKNALQQNQNYVAAHILLGEIYLKQKSLSEAEVQINLANQLGADRSLTVKPLAQLYLYQIKYNQLIKEIEPSNYGRELRPELHIFRGHAYLQLNLLSEALNEYEMAAQIDANQIDAIIGKANTLLRRGDMEGASQAAEKAMQMQPENADTWFARASIKHAKFAMEEALKDYDKALELLPDHLDARIARAGILMDLKQDERAEQDLEFLRKTYPFEPKAAYLHSVLLQRMGQTDASVKELEAAADILAGIKPEYLGAHGPTLMLSGLVNYGLQRLDIAADYLRQYVKQYPEQPGPYKLLAAILLSKHEPEQVIDLLRPVQLRNPNDHRLLFLLGSAYMQVGKHDMANSLLDKASAMNTEGENIHSEIGLNRLSMGQEQPAINELEAGFKDNPGNTQAGIPLVALYISRGESEKALRVAKAMHEKASKNLTLLNLLGTAQVSAQQLQQARRSFENAVELDPNFITAHLNLSKLDVAEKKLDQARKRLAALNQKTPNNVPILLELATVEQAAGNYDSANTWLENARKLDQKSLPVLLSLVNLKLKIGRPSEALAIAQAAELIEKNNIEVMDALAKSYLATNSREKALGVFIRMAEQARFNVKQLYKAARYQIENGDNFEAIKTLKKAVLADENHIPSQIALVEMELNYGKPVFALSRAENLLKQYPKRSFPHRLLGDIAVHEKNISLANTHYQAAFDLEPNAGALMQLHDILKKTSQADKAFDLLDQWVKKHPKDSVPMAALADELLQAGKLNEAEKYYDTLLKQFPQEPQFLNNLAYIFLTTGNEKALSYAEQAQKLAPDQASTNDTLGWILVNQGQAEQGLNYLRNAHSRLSQDPEIRYHIAVALHQLQRKDEARQELESILKSGESFNGIEQAKALLQKLKP